MKQIYVLALASIVLLSCQSTIKQNENEQSDNFRIVSLAPSITKELCYLGVADLIVGVTSYCDLAKENKDLVIGTAIDVNVEKILLLKPNVVIATTLTKASNIETLKENGINVYQIGKMHSYTDICHEFKVMGKLVGRENEAQTIIERANAKIDSLQNTIINTDSLKVFFQIGAKPLFAVIPDTFMDDLIAFAKCKNLASDMEHGTISRETVINRNPDVIYVATMGIVGDEEKQIWESYSDLNAVKNKKVLVIDSNMACTPSVTSFLESLTQMVNEIYK